MLTFNDVTLSVLREDEKRCPTDQPALNVPSSVVEDDVTVEDSIVDCVFVAQSVPSSSKSYDRNLGPVVPLIGVHLGRVGQGSQPGAGFAECQRRLRQTSTKGSVVGDRDVVDESDMSTRRRSPNSRTTSASVSGRNLLLPDSAIFRNLRFCWNPKARR